uniref:uncharacterized protein LOC120346955 n=1 Tax=Styela clava TaxID=7725 RepID=UPI0019397E96|nr:uncharacterized protein LOC120346955 [Styela clava]
MILCKSPLLLACLCMVCEIATCCYSTCCCKSLDMIDCSKSSVISPPKPKTDAKGWCGNLLWDNNGSSIITILLSKDTAKVDKGMFRHYPNILNISLNGCKLTSLGEDEFHLPEYGESKLEVLKLRNNNIKKVDINAFRGLTNLVKLDLSWNENIDLQPGVFNGLTKLTELKLDGNSISSLDMKLFEGLISLKYLTINSNQLKVLLPFPSDIMDLNNLELRNSSISELSENTFANLHNIITLDLSYNHLTELNENIFENNRELVRVHLNNNRLKTIPENTFSNLCDLSFLDISSNRLSTPHYQWFANMVFWLTRNDQELEKYHGRPVTVDNDWKCDEDSIKYQVMLGQLCTVRNMVSSNWFDALNIICISDGKKQYLSSPTCETSPTINMGMIPSLHPNSTCPREDPFCRFLSPVCANVPNITSPRPEPNVAPENIGIKKIFFFVAFGLILVIVFLLIIVNRAREAKKRQYSYSSDEPSIYEPDAQPSLSYRSSSESGSERPTLSSYSESNYGESENIGPIPNGPQPMSPEPGDFVFSQPSVNFFQPGIGSGCGCPDFTNTRNDNKSWSTGPTSSLIAQPPSLRHQSSLSTRHSVLAPLNSEPAPSMKSEISSLPPHFMSHIWQKPYTPELFSTSSDFGYPSDTGSTGYLFPKYENHPFESNPEQDSLAALRPQVETIPKVISEEFSPSVQSTGCHENQIQNDLIDLQSISSDLETTADIAETQTKSLCQSETVPKVISQENISQQPNLGPTHSEQETQLKTIFTCRNKPRATNLYEPWRQIPKSSQRVQSGLEPQNVTPNGQEDSSNMVSPDLDPIYTPMRPQDPATIPPAPNRLDMPWIRTHPRWCLLHTAPSIHPVTHFPSHIHCTPSYHMYSEIFPPNSANLYLPVNSIPFVNPEPEFARIWSPPLPVPFSLNQYRRLNEYADEIPHGLPQPDPNGPGRLQAPEKAVLIPSVVYRDVTTSETQDDQRKDKAMEKIKPKAQKRAKVKKADKKAIKKKRKAK